MNRDFKREYIDEEITRVTEQIRVGIFSLTAATGTSFIATSLAKYLAEKKMRAVAFVDLKQENGKDSLTFHALGMDKRFASREFTSFFSKIKSGQHIKLIKNMDAGINWAIRTPKDREQEVFMTPLEEARLIHNICADMILCDFGSAYHRESLYEMDVLVCVIDPIPSKLMASKSLFCELRGEIPDDRTIVWIVNKNNPGVNNRLLKTFLKLKNPITIPLIPEEWFYVAQYHCRLPFEQTEIKKHVLPMIEELVNRHILVTEPC